MGLTLAFPALTHLAEPASVAAPPLPDDEVERRLENIVPVAPPDSR
jgi:hypothetical protein